MWYKNIALITFLFCLGACNNEIENSNTDSRTISTDEYDDVKILQSEIFGKRKFIVLESKKNSLIGKIDNLQIKDSVIYILDNTYSNALSAFSLSGEFKFKIKQIGRGRGEYLRLV